MDNLDILFERLNSMGLKNLTYNDIYNEVLHFNIQDNIKAVRIDNNFNKWLAYYNDSKLKVCENKDDRSCSFINSDTKFDRANYELIIPFNPDNMFMGVDLIEDFLLQNNIKSQAKVSDTLCATSYTVKLYKREDVQKLASYIKNSINIRRMLMPINPFLPNDGVLGYSLDTTSNYMKEFAYIIADYYNALKKGSNSIRPNKKGFINFIKKENELLYTNLNEEMIKYFKVTRDINNGEYSVMADSYIMRSLILSKMQGDFNIDVLDQKYLYANSIEKMDAIDNKMEKVFRKIQYVKIETPEQLRKKKNIILGIGDILSEYGYENTKKILIMLTNQGKTSADLSFTKYLEGCNREDFESVIINQVGSVDFDAFLNIVSRQRSQYKNEEFVKNILIDFRKKFDSNMFFKIEFSMYNGSYNIIENKEIVEKLEALGVDNYRKIIANILVENGLDPDINRDRNLCDLISNEAEKEKIDEEEKTNSV